MVTTQRFRDPADRRVHRRAPLGVPALVDLISMWQKARCTDVSAGGVALESCGSLPINAELDLYFELPTGVAVETRAVVVRCTENRAGLKFVQLCQEPRNAITSYCRTWQRVRVSSGTYPIAVPYRVEIH